jgi:hypothetical protein
MDPIEIGELFGHDVFDATSGHLPFWMMARLAEKYRQLYSFSIPSTEDAIEIPTGSGETIGCLRMAFPTVSFIPVWDSTQPNLEYHPPCDTARVLYNEREGYNRPKETAEGKEHR